MYEIDYLISRSQNISRMFELKCMFTMSLLCFMTLAITAASEDLGELVPVLSTKKRPFSEPSVSAPLLHSADGKQHKCIFAVYQNLLSGHSLEESMQMLPVNVNSINTVRCLTGSKTGKYSV